MSKERKGPNPVLSNYKKVGQKLIPPMMHSFPIVETSFRNDMLPDLIWLSAIFLRGDDRNAIKHFCDFVIEASKALEPDTHPPLCFLESFVNLSEQQKNKIKAQTIGTKYLDFILENTLHQAFLLKNYPLEFLFTDYLYGVDRIEAIDQLKEDVSGLLDRNSIHATKIQVTALFSMVASGKLMISSHIDLPDFNCIFTNPDSTEAKRLASFARASLNGGPNIGSSENKPKVWASEFWQQAYNIGECI